MKKPNKKKKIILAVTALVLAAAIGAGVFLVKPGSAEPVGVYSFDYLGMTEYWGDTQESYGPVSSDNIQTVFLTDTQIVTEIKVKSGDTVKKGDVLMTFDTTLSGLSLERKRLDMEKKKLSLEIAQRELGDILMMEPMEEPEYTQPEEDEEEEVNLGIALTEDCLISDNSAYDGSSEEKALICWLKDTTSINTDILEAVRLMAEEIQTKNSEEKVPSSASALPELLESIFEEILSSRKPGDTPPDEEETDQKPEETPDDGETPDTEETPDGEETPDTEETPDGEETPDTEETPDGEETPDTEETPDDEEIPDGEEIPDPDEDTDEEENPDEDEEDDGESEEVLVTEFYVVFKTTQDNMSLGARLTWEGLHVTKDDDGDFHFRFYDASSFSDYTIVTEDAEEEIILPDIDLGSGYTLAQIVQMKAAKEKEIKQLEFDLKMAETEYKIMQNELEDGNVYAAVDGQVVSVLTEEEARQSRQPIIKVSGGGGFYVQCSVSELEKENMQLGQEVTVNDWNTGMTYTGTVEAMGDFPSADGYWNGMGNPNTTYYPFTVFIDGSADLQTGSYVSVMYSTAGTEHGIYLENPFLRTEKDGSYVYVLGAGGKLEKRYVVTGKSLYGSYTEILSGITKDDLIAFPYGKNVKEGAPAEEGDISELYSY